MPVQTSVPRKKIKLSKPRTNTAEQALEPEKPVIEATPPKPLPPASIDQAKQIQALTAELEDQITEQEFLILELIADGEDVDKACTSYSSSKSSFYRMLTSKPVLWDAYRKAKEFKAESLLARPRKSILSNCPIISLIGHCVARCAE